MENKMTKAACCLAALILGCVTIFFIPVLAALVLAMGLWIILTGNITINGDDNDDIHKMGNGKFTENNP